MDPEYNLRELKEALKRSLETLMLIFNASQLINRLSGEWKLNFHS